MIANNLDLVNDHGASNGINSINGANGDSITNGSPKHGQDPIAVVGVACRLPGHSMSPKALWDFIERGGIAHNEPPSSRFNLKGHFDKSQKPLTMRSPGGMFLEDVDLHAFDAQFFNTSRVDAIAMDPQQRQLLEIVYECLENAGVTLEQVSGAQIGCFVGSYAVDFADMQARDPEDRAESITIGIGRAILSNRISHFLNIKGPSMTIDTACSGSLVSVDVACQYLQSRQADGVIVAASNMYMSPDHNMDMGAMRGASSATGKCHTFDAKADGYIKAEAANAVFLKRLDDAIRDGDPIRAIIRGTATNSDGRTPGIASPSSEAQAAAIRAAYANAGITDFNETSYLECHGTGTLAGDPIEVQGAASVFAPTRSIDNPLIIGSIKSNIGHSEPAAGISGLLKAVLAVENGIIPGNPTFIDPNPKIDFEKLRVRATRSTIKWPDVSIRRASVNSFGYGGSNAHVVVEAAEHFLKRPLIAHTSSYIQSAEDFFGGDDDSTTSKKPSVLVFSANDEESLKSYIKSLSAHLINPSVNIKLNDLAYTLSERRTRHFQRAFLVTKTTSVEQDSLVFGKRSADPPKIGFIFTGQGAQWSQMGKDLVQLFPSAKSLLQDLDKVLQSLPNPPKWSLLSELVEPRSPEHLRLPEFSQPLVTALQLAMMVVLSSWGIKPEKVVGHSSGEIAAACAAGLLSPQEAIKIAYFRGLAAKERPSPIPVGMLAVGIGADDIQKYLTAASGLVQVACYNSPNSLTLSGSIAALDEVKSRLQEDNHFARMLQVDLAYHSKYMSEIGDYYEKVLLENCEAPLSGTDAVKMFSSVTGQEMDLPADATYWKSNMVSPVRFSQACADMLSGKDGADFLIEIGPSNTMIGPVSQIKKTLSGEGSHISYTSAAKRGPDTMSSLFGVAGRVYIAGGSVSLSDVNKDEERPEKPAFITDLPNYAWNHSTKYWQESQASKDWRFRKFVQHDLLGSKILGTSWDAPSWKKTLRLADVPWLQDHKMGHEIIFPGAGYIAMAVEAVYQTTLALGEDKEPANYRYNLRDLKFPRALVLDENSEQRVMLSLMPVPGSTKSWYEYKVSSFNGETWAENSTGFIRIETEFQDTQAADGALEPLQYPTPGHLWYKAMHDAGYNFGPQFQKHLEAETTTGERYSRSLVSLEEPPSRWGQSRYPMHPACIDGCFQSVAPSLWLGDRSSINAVLVPAVVDSLTIKARPQQPSRGMSVTTSEYLGVGRKEDMKNYASNCTVYDPNDGSMLFELKGLRYHKLETREDVYTSHMYTCLDWKADVTSLTESKLQSLLVGENLSSVQEVIDLVAHKNPNLKVMEMNLSPQDTSSLWLQNSPAQSAIRAALKEYHFVSNDPTALLNAQEQYSGAGNTVFSLLDATKDDFAPPSTDFDLVIIKSTELSRESSEIVGRHIHKLLDPHGYALFVEVQNEQVNGNHANGIHINGNHTNGNHVNGIHTNGYNSTLPTDLSTVLTNQGFVNIQKFGKIAYLAAASELDNGEINPEINVVHLVETTPAVSKVKNDLRDLGWKVCEHSYPFKDLQPKSNVLVLDELSGPVLATANKTQWEAIQQVIQKESNLLWVTVGSQMEVTDPTKAVAHGLLRTIRAEEPTLSLMTLDVESVGGPATVESINMVFKMLSKPKSMKQIESEYVERRGILHVSRILPDQRLNVVKFEDSQGVEAEDKDLHANKNCVRLICEHLGNIDSLHYCEISPDLLPLKDNNVEVELFAAALNFKDVAVSMGIVPENEHLLGLEGAGVITRVADDVTNRKVGQRVVVFEKGTFANRIQATTERTYPLPDSMSFEEAATLPAVYLTSMYSLFYLADLRKGQRVLIHSASGGVGIASIQLCQYMGCEVFVTVGAEEKREFLMKSFGIPADRIFSSRTSEFARKIMKITNGEGIDVILNSLTGDLLDESWRIIADGGTMVEIGKKDIIDRNTLSMEPFGRNASFRALDFSYRQISDALIAKILSELFQLIEQGHVKPIFPVRTFPFEDIQAAFRVLRGGKHIGKLVISNGPNPKIEVPVRPAKRTLSLRSDVSYLIVGGLKGLCGSLAVYLAKKGAKHLAVISRSGHQDERSQGVVKNIHALGCQIDLLQGNIADVEDVRRCFKEATVPIGGIIQGAMVLRDRIFASMTIDEYHGALACKVQGTWNLHNVALEQNLSLDFFTMLSSISGVVGQKGQANYAGGNTFLDSLAVYRHGLGLRACSVDLGVIEDVGYIHQNEGLQQNLDTSIWTGINEGLLRKILEYSIFQQINPINPASSRQLITGIPVPQPEDSQLLVDARFAGLFVKDSSRASGGDGKDGSKDIQAFFLLLRSKASPVAVLAAAVDVVNKHFTKSLRLAELMEPGRPISIYGLDSLAAVEIRNWVRMVLGAELTTLEIVNATSLVSLCEKIISRIAPA